MRRRPRPRRVLPDRRLRTARGGYSGAWLQPYRFEGTGFVWPPRAGEAIKAHGRARGKRWCGRRDLNPHSPCGKTDFHTRLRFSPPLLPSRKVWGLDYPFTIPDWFRLRCCPSSLYTFPDRISPIKAWLGIAISQGSPTLSSSASPVSRRALKFALKSVASADSATPARFQR